jgi:hypothetical protein
MDSTFETSNILVVDNSIDSTSNFFQHLIPVAAPNFSQSILRRPVFDTYNESKNQSIPLKFNIFYKNDQTNISNRQNLLNERVSKIKTK